LAIVADPKIPDWKRGFAVDALGQIADRSEVPVLARLAASVNYRALPPVLQDVLAWP
jgi:hypothetical protein